jgi:hypothetical protein
LLVAEVADTTVAAVAAQVVTDHLYLAKCPEEGSPQNLLQPYCPELTTLLLSVLEQLLDQTAKVETVAMAP